MNKKLAGNCKVCSENILRPQSDEVPHSDEIRYFSLVCPWHKFEELESTRFEKLCFQCTGIKYMRNTRRNEKKSTYRVQQTVSQAVRQFIFCAHF